jgi:hypothetical protein
MSHARPPPQRRSGDICYQFTPGRGSGGQASRHHFVDWLVSAGQTLAILSRPWAEAIRLTTALSSAGNPLLIDLDNLVRPGLAGPGTSTGLRPGYATSGGCAPWPPAGRLAGLHRTGAAPFVGPTGVRIEQADWLEGLCAVHGGAACMANPGSMKPRSQPTRTTGIGRSDTGRLGFSVSFGGLHGAVAKLDLCALNATC